jgi:hypothetical protein
MNGAIDMSPYINMGLKRADWPKQSEMAEDYF